MIRRIIDGLTYTSCFTSSSYHCMKEIQKRERYCINTHSLMVQIIVSVTGTYLFMIRMHKRLNFTLKKFNFWITFGWNGSGLTKQNYSQILRGIQKKIVRLTLLINNLDSKDDFDESNYSLKFNLPSLREFGNVYNKNYMTLF
jgi:hypothetical protein